MILPMVAVNGKAEGSDIILPKGVIASTRLIEEAEIDDFR